MLARGRNHQQKNGQEEAVVKAGDQAEVVIRRVVVVETGADDQYGQQNENGLARLQTG